MGMVGRLDNSVAGKGTVSLHGISNSSPSGNDAERFWASASSNATSFVCPVCSASLRLDTEKEMGKHVEDCLSHQEVAALVEEEKSNRKQENKRKLVELET